MGEWGIAGDDKVRLWSRHGETARMGVGIRRGERLLVI